MGPVTHVYAADRDRVCNDEPYYPTAVEIPNMQRIVACVNVCAGIPTRELDYLNGPDPSKGHGSLRKNWDAVQMRRERDELVAHRNDAVKMNRLLINDNHDLVVALEAVLLIADRKHDVFDAARAALAKAKERMSP